MLCIEDCKTKQNMGLRRFYCEFRILIESLRYHRRSGRCYVTDLISKRAGFPGAFLFSVQRLFSPQITDFIVRYLIEYK